jgi:hypothetical protein
MASGHVNRTQRPNTWLHRPSLRREDSPCQLGAVHTWPITTFRCVAEFGRYRGNIGLSAAERPEDLWVRGLEVLAAAVSAFFSDALMTP